MGGGYNVFVSIFVFVFFSRFRENVAPKHLKLTFILYSYILNLLLFSPSLHRCHNAADGEKFDRGWTWTRHCRV